MLVVGRVAQRSAPRLGSSCRPQETLFTVIPREQKYKSKAFIDTAVVRGGDVLASWVYSGLRFTGLTLSGLAIAMVPICLRLVLGGLVARFGGGTASTDDGGITPIASLDRQVVRELEIRQFRPGGRRFRPGGPTQPLPVA